MQNATSEYGVFPYSTFKTSECFVDGYDKVDRTKNLNDKCDKLTITQKFTNLLTCFYTIIQEK